MFSHLVLLSQATAPSGEYPRISRVGKDLQGSSSPGRGPAQDNTKNHTMCQRWALSALLQTTFLLLQSLKGSSIFCCCCHHWIPFSSWFAVIFNSGVIFTFPAAHTHPLMMLIRQGPFPAPSRCMECGDWQSFPFLYSLLVSLHVPMTEKPLSLTSASGPAFRNVWSLCSLLNSYLISTNASLFEISESESNYVQIVKSWKWGGLRKGMGKDIAWEHLIKYLELSS